jgi:glycosyltransferase involved in cell wall biosynthesis
VVPSFNQGRYIAATLDSLLLQRYPNLVLHVQDGASTDHTIELLRHYHELYPDCFSYLSEPDRGQADAINRGFSRVEGDIMGWMNSDDIALPGSLFLIASELMCDPSIDVVYGDRLLISSDSRVVGRWCLPGHRDSDLFYAFWIPQETMFWRRSAWTISGQHVNTDLRFALDWDLVLRFLGAGCKFKHIPFYLGALRVYPEQKSQDLMESVGLREMDLVRLSNHLCQLVPRMCREHVQNVRGFHYRQKIASFWRLSSVYLLHSIGPRFAHRLGLSVVLLDVGSCQIAGRR